MPPSYGTLLNCAMHVPICNVWRKVKLVFQSAMFHSLRLHSEAVNITSTEKGAASPECTPQPHQPDRMNAHRVLGHDTQSNGFQLFTGYQP